MSLAAIVLAAGMGTRMKSKLPKVLHTVLGKPMLHWVLDKLPSAGVDRSVVIVSDEVWKSAQNYPPSAVAASPVYCLQEDKRGTGDAVASAALGFRLGVQAPFMKAKLLGGNPVDADWVLILTADAPAVDIDLLKAFIHWGQSKDLDFGVLGMRLAQPFGYGRLVAHKNGHLLKIVEEKDASPAEKAVDLCNSGVILAKRDKLFAMINKLDNQNAAREYYLTDCVALANAAGLDVGAYATTDATSLLGVNDPWQLAQVEASMLERLQKSLAMNGVRFLNPASIYLEAWVQIGTGSIVGSGCALLGRTRIEDDVEIGAGSVLNECTVGRGARIGANCVLKNRTIKAGEIIPPASVLS